MSNKRKINTNKKEPTESAGQQDIGIRLPGKDGFLYRCDVKSDKTKYWKKTLVTAKKLPRVVGKEPIFIGEPATANGFIIKVTPKFLEVLRKKPKYVSRSDGNAYVFGELKSEYYEIGSHMNDVAQTGIIHAKGVKNWNDITGFNNSIDIWLDIYDVKKKGPIRWDNRKLLSKAQTIISDKILFVGDTDGGDVGAAALVHLNSKKEIDSLIIDNYVYY